MKAQEKLQKSTEALGAALQKYSDKFSDFPEIADSEVKAALTESGDFALGNTGKAFDGFVGYISAAQEKQNETISGKVSKFMKQVYPVAVIALGVVSFTADVRLYSASLFKVEIPLMECIIGG